ncbi:MAG: polyphosphate polymerase domain-containing protein [Fibrobacter sp.]|jgi:hypothetical protein|nr:polyphosphate polymerase domain-containing protein [Fibrobacter sp.]HON10758.1 polyphosphate polymerase domain-containing protein [Chitinispirillaceae bacterium]
MVNTEVEQKIGVSTAVTPSLLNRYEAKYLIPFSMIGPIVEFIKPYCSYDKYSALSEDRFYKVNSLYFDTPDYLFLHQRIYKAEKRFNMRIRSYGDHPVMPYFFEIKQRLGDIIRKIRAKIDDPDYAELFNRSGVEIRDGEDQKNELHRELFYRTASKYNAAPVVLVQYRRQAFFSTCDDYARVTFDIDIHAMEKRSYDPVPEKGKIFRCSTGFDGERNVILELKCFKDSVPSWMIDLIRAFQLQRRGFSKYSTCLQNVFDRKTQDQLLSYNPSRCASFFRG